MEEDEEHLISTILSLFKYSSAVPKDRILYKFKEKNSEKIERLLELHEKYVSIYHTYINECSDKGSAEVEDLYIKYLGQGLFTLQMIDMILGFLIISQDKQVLLKIQGILHLREIDLDVIISVIHGIYIYIYIEYVAHIQSEEDDEESGIDDRKIFFTLTTQLDKVLVKAHTKHEIVD